MGEFWQTLAAVALGGVLTLLTGYALWKAERAATLREQRREALKTAHSAMYDAYNAIDNYGLFTLHDEERLEARLAVRHAANEFLKRNMWLGGLVDERGAPESLTDFLQIIVRHGVERVGKSLIHECPPMGLLALLEFIAYAGEQRGDRVLMTSNQVQQVNLLHAVQPVRRRPQQGE